MSLHHLFNNTVFLLGAGASRSSGCLVSGEMLTALEKNISALSQESVVEKDIGYQYFQVYRKDFEEIYHFIFASLKYQIALKNSAEDITFNVEDFVLVLRQLIDKEYIIPFPLVGNWNDKILKWEIRYRDENIFALFKNFIVYELTSKWVIHDPEAAKELLAPIADLITDPDNFIMNFFSLNYDLVFESTFNSDELHLLEDGFTMREVDEDRLAVWDSNVFDRMGSEEFSHSPSDNEKIYLYKMHGSINWNYNNSYELITKNELEGQSDEMTKEPLIIFGSTSKMLSFDPFLFFLSEFRNQLKKSKLYIVIGYSFHDKYINNLLIQQLSEDTNKTLLIVDPYIDSDPSSFAERLKNIQDARSINDIINFKKLSPSQIQIINMSAADFFREYLSDNAAKLQEELSRIEQEDRPFT